MLSGSIMRPYIVTYEHIDESVSYRLRRSLIDKQKHVESLRNNDEPEFEAHKLKWVHKTDLRKDISYRSTMQKDTKHK